MTIDELDLILTAVSQHFTLAPDAEVSMEANPGTVDSAYLAALRELGVNRLSFGAQTAVSSELALLEREHSFADVQNAITQSRAVGFDNLSIDLIYGLPNQTMATWEQSLQAALALELEHISLYCLTIEAGTPMQRWMENGRFSPPDPDLAADQYELATELLPANGLEQYEISNWAKPNRACRHNLTYWRNRPYLGLGAGAHGYANGVRYEVVKQPRVYIRRMAEKPSATGALPFPLTAAVAKHHHVNRAEAMSDTVITQLRLLQEGLDLPAFEAEFGQPFADVYPQQVAQLLEWGMLEIVGKWLRLTKNGRFLSNQVFYRFM
jgi:oxygen-independent coproporphyrinogen-3 oxidase